MAVPSAQEVNGRRRSASILQALPVVVVLSTTDPRNSTTSIRTSMGMATMSTETDTSKGTASSTTNRTTTKEAIRRTRTTLHNRICMDGGPMRAGEAARLCHEEGEVLCDLRPVMVDEVVRIHHAGVACHQAAAEAILQTEVDALGPRNELATLILVSNGVSG
jgi:hypothetical protein